MTLEGHDIHEENVGAYLLGALDETEAGRFERHIAQCHLCHDEIERLRPVVDALPRTVIPMRAPSALKASIMDAVEEDLRARGELVEPAREKVFRRLAALRGRVAGGGLRVGPAYAWVSVAVVLVVGVLAGVGLTQVTSSDAATRTVEAKVDRSRVPSASASLVVPAKLDDGAVLRVHGMPTLASESIYEVWIQRHGEVIPQSLFDVGSDGDGAAAIAGDLRGADAVMVTREPAGGSKAPSERAVMRVDL